MINLNEVANKVSEILNSVDNPLRIDKERVIFDVATEGYRVDSIAKREEGKNAIPVFIALAGGENQPIPNLSQQSKSFNIAIYYPIIYKDIFIDLEDYLDSVVVGKMINFGESTGECLCNLGVAQFGEIQNLDLEAFKSFVANKYEKTIEISVNWHSMVLPFFATKLEEGYIFGNELTFTLKMAYLKPKITAIVLNNAKTYAIYPQEDKIIDTKHYYAFRTSVFGGYEYLYILDDPDSNEGIVKLLGTKNKVETYKYVLNEMVLQDEKVDYCLYEKSETEQILETNTVRSEAGTGASISPIAEQRIGLDSYAKNVSNITNFNKSLVAYPKMTELFWQMYLIFYNKQILDYIERIDLIKKYSNYFEFETKQIVLQHNENGSLGLPLTFTLTFGDSK